MADTIIPRLTALMGRTVNYENTEHLLIGWELHEQQVTIEHDGGQWHIDLAKLAAVMQAWEGQLQRRGVTLTAPLPDVAAPNSTLREVSSLLLDSMRKVRDDVGYAPQAKAMADTAQVIINAAKVQVEAARLLVEAQNG
jgi:hypothetical protein